MESKTAKESVVARLFGFGRRRDEKQPPPPESPSEQGFARVEDPESEESESQRVTIPEQVLRVRTTPKRAKDEAIGAITDSFQELTSLLGSVSDRLDRQDNRSSDLAEQLKELPDYLQALPRLQREQNDTLRTLNEHVAHGNEISRTVGMEHSQAVRHLAERVADGTDAVHGVADAIAKIPEELRERSESHEDAIRQVASAQKQTAKVIYAGHQKSLQLFHQATQKTLLVAQRNAKAQREQMEEVLAHSVANAKRVFLLAAAFMGAALISVVALLMFG